MNSHIKKEIYLKLKEQTYKEVEKKRRISKTKWLFKT